MTETHPYGNFVPQKAEYLILGSFPGKHDEVNNWFYSSKRNQFWPILEEIYKQNLKSKKEKQKLLIGLKIAMADIIYKCDRRKNSNLDINLVNLVYNVKGIEKILKENKIRKIFFTSRFVEKKFGSIFKNTIDKYPQIRLVHLPSPSPRYAVLTKQRKVREYKKKLPIS